MGKTNICKNLTTIKPEEPTGPIKLDAFNGGEAIRAAEKQVIDQKCKLANLTVKQLQAAQDTVRLEKALIDKINEFARVHGITHEDEGKWNFNIADMTFTKITQQQ